MSTYNLGHIAGNKWYYGNYVSRNGDEVIVSNDGIPPKVYSNDFYINVTTGDYFQCTVDATTSQVTWSYVGTMRGQQGTVGPKGDTGDQGPDGRVYIPSVNDTGVLTWTLGSGVENIPSANIRGPAFHFDAVGAFSDRPVSASTGYAYLVTSGVDGDDVDRAGFIYVKTDDGWSDPFAFKGDKGDMGAVLVPVVTSGTMSWVVSSGAVSVPNPVSIVGPQGEQGVSIESIVQNNVNALSGASNVVSVVMTDSSVSTFTVYNGERGDSGVSIQSVSEALSNEDNGVNVVTLAMTDGTSSSFSVRNGSKGNKGTTWHIGEAIEGHEGDEATSFVVDNLLLSTDGIRYGDFYLNSNTNEYYKCEQVNEGVSTSWIYIGNIQGKKGEIGAIFTSGTAGPIESRYFYDNENEGFCYYAYDIGKVYVRTSEMDNSDDFWDSGHEIHGEKGEIGETGAVFVPTITSGTLSWTNNGGYTNPSPVNLMKAGANLVCSPTPPENPYNGMLWVKTTNSTSNLNIDSLNVIVGGDTVVAPKNGDLWIK